jgi:hypothetical protein
MNQLKDRDQKYVNAGALFLNGKVKRSVRGLTVDYFEVGKNKPTIGIDLNGKDRTGCDCIFESIQGAKKQLCCKDLIAATIYNSLRPFIDSGELKLMVKKGTDWEELKLE